MTTRTFTKYFVDPLYELAHDYELSINIDYVSQSIVLKTVHTCDTFPGSLLAKLSKLCSSRLCSDNVLYWRIASDIERPGILVFTLSFTHGYEEF